MQSLAMAESVSIIKLFQFHKLTLGYGNTSGVETLQALLSAQREPEPPLPGEGEPTVTLLKRVVGYLEESAAWQDLLNSTDYFYNAVNGLLMHSNSIINHQVCLLPILSY